MTGAGTGRQYHHMNAGAHRRPPPQIGAPALTWQRGFWGSPQVRSEAGESGSHWQLRAENTLAHIFRYLLSYPGAECTSPNYDPGTKTLYLFDHKVTDLSGDTCELEILAPSEKSVRHVVFTARARFCGLWLTVSARLHHENFVILFALDFSGELNRKAPDATALTTMYDGFFSLHDLVIDRYDNHANGKGGRPVDATYSEDRENAVAFSQQLIEGFRSFVDKIVTEACDDACNNEPVGLRGFEDPFSDFVGVVYSLRCQPGEKLRYAHYPEDQQFLRMSARVCGTDFQKNGVEILDAAWPVLTAADVKSDQDRLHGNPEYVVAAFNGGQTLYVSSLGRLSSGQRKRDLVPLVYTLIVSYASPWRLGRFIDKLHTAGTLRLAALRDLEKINAASNKIDYLSRSLTSHHVPDRRQALPENLELQFAQIGRDMDFGLAYRIGRSRYYVHSYKDTVDALRPDRIPGYQFYVDFVRARVYDAFDYIDRVGKKYDELKREIDFRTSLARRQEARSLLQATERQARAAASLLEAAEFLSVIPLTYYSAHILSEIVPPLRSFYGLYLLPTGALSWYLIGLLGSVLLAGGSHVYRRRRENRQKVQVVLDKTGES